jgi:hypothetical protein
MRFFRDVWVIALKDLRAEVRTKEAVNGSLAFALVILLIFSFAFDAQEDTTREISGGLLWIAFAFAGTLILNRSFAREIAAGYGVGFPPGLQRVLQRALDGPIRLVGAGIPVGHLGHHRDRHHDQRADGEYPPA